MTTRNYLVYSYMIRVLFRLPNKTGLCILQEGFQDSPSDIFLPVDKGVSFEVAKCAGIIFYATLCTELLSAAFTEYRGLKIIQYSVFGR